jgi:hypothetical protein
VLGKLLELIEGMKDSKNYFLLPKCCVLTTVKAYLLVCTVTQAAQEGGETGREGRLRAEFRAWRKRATCQSAPFLRKGGPLE